MMDRRITENEIHYLMDHLAMLYKGADLQKFLITHKPESGEAVSGEAAMIFPLSERPLDQEKVVVIREVPVLFPLSESREWYSVEEKNVRFHHDILKSAFYLLSGYQEYENREMDVHGRYPWKSSIQYRLGFTQKPVVNYYFEVILEAFEKFCQINGTSFQRIHREAPVLFLSHDVDRIKKYSLRNLGYVALQLAGIKPSANRTSKRLKTVVDYSKGTLLFRKDPYWNFQELLQMERELKISSTWYFLEKTRKDNSRYHFGDTPIRDLIMELSRLGHEIGIHGTVESSEDPGAMTGGIQRLNGVSEHPVSGIRQHYLKYSNPATSRIQADTTLAYDATLGFAEHIGFRNSYAYPFRLYDFDNQEPLDLWQIPLNIMDVTLLGYMMVPVTAIPEAIRPVIREVSRFRGVLALLWHNCNLDEEEFPGVNTVYRGLVEEIMNSGFSPMTGDQVIKSFGS